MALLCLIRYPHQTWNSNNPETAHLQLDFQNREDWNPILDDTNYVRDLTQSAPISFKDNEFNDHYSEFNHSERKTNFSNRESHTPQHHQTPLVHRGKRHPIRNLSEQWKFGSDHSHGPLTPGRQIPLQNATQKQDPQMGQAQFKEKVFIWAHGIFLNLLASVQQSRCNVSNGHHQGERRFLSSMYPRPLRRSFLNPYRDYSHFFQNREDFETRVGAFDEVGEKLFHHKELSKTPDATQSGSLDEREAFVQRPPNISPHYDYNSHHIWQPNGRLHSSLHPTLSPISQFRSLAPQATHNQYELSPSSAAVTALEMLNRLCQESNWEWTDGMLLGGCLADVLGDHTKAMKWYTGVLSCDPK